VAGDIKPGSRAVLDPVFKPELSLKKSDHDFVFRPRGETLGRVQTPLQRNQG